MRRDTLSSVPGDIRPSDATDYKTTAGIYSIYNLGKGVQHFRN